MTTEKLKPCPCCGSKAELYESIDSLWVIQCTLCGVGTLHMPTKDEAIIIWNNRVKQKRRIIKQKQKGNNSEAQIQIGVINL